MTEQAAAAHAVANEGANAPDVSNYSPESVARMMAELEAYRERERIEKKNHELRERYRKEPRAISTRNTLVLRRTPNHHIIAPYEDVLDYIDLYDMKDPAKAKAEGKKIQVSDEEIKAFQKLKSDDGAKITLQMVTDTVVALYGRVKATSTEAVDTGNDQDSFEG